MTSPLNPPRDYLLALLFALAIIGCAAITEARSSADASGSWSRGKASAYGPGLYGNRTACRQTLTSTTRGVAHRTLPCGTRLRICRSGRCTTARVIDRGPYSGDRVLDLTARTARDLCSCRPSVWGVRIVNYRRAA